MTDGIETQPLNSSPETTNLLSPNKYQVVISKFPNVNYFTQRVPIPTVTLGQAVQATNQEVDIKWPGDKLEFEDLILSVMMDENLAGYQEIYDWLFECASSEMHEDDVFSDISIIMLTNNSNKNKILKFHNAWPQTLGNILMDVTATEDQPLSTDIIFKYTHFTIT